jgi:hypothetical protein
VGIFVSAKQTRSIQKREGKFPWTSCIMTSYCAQKMDNKSAVAAAWSIHKIISPAFLSTWNPPNLTFLRKNQQPAEAGYVLVQGIGSVGRM